MAHAQYAVAGRGPTHGQVAQLVEQGHGARLGDPESVVRAHPWPHVDGCKLRHLARWQEGPAGPYLVAEVPATRRPTRSGRARLG